MSFMHAAPHLKGPHRPRRSTVRFLIVVLAYLIIGTLMWWIVGLATPDGRTSNPPFGHPQNESISVLAPHL